MTCDFWHVSKGHMEHIPKWPHTDWHQRGASSAFQLFTNQNSCLWKDLNQSSGNSSVCHSWHDFFLPALGCLESWAFTRAVPGSAPGRRRSFPQRALGRVGPKAQIFKGILLPKGVVRAQQGFHTLLSFGAVSSVFSVGIGITWCRFSFVLEYT